MMNRSTSRSSSNASYDTDMSGLCDTYINPTIGDKAGLMESGNNGSDKVNSNDNGIISDFDNNESNENKMNLDEMSENEEGFKLWVKNVAFWVKAETLFKEFELFFEKKRDPSNKSDSDLNNGYVKSVSIKMNDQKPQFSLGYGFVIVSNKTMADLMVKSNIFVVNRPLIIRRDIPLKREEDSDNLSSSRNGANNGSAPVAATSEETNTIFVNNTDNGSGIITANVTPIRIRTRSRRYGNGMGNDSGNRSNGNENGHYLQPPRPRSRVQLMSNSNSPQSRSSYRSEYSSNNDYKYLNFYERAVNVNHNDSKGGSFNNRWGNPNPNPGYDRFGRSLGNAGNGNGFNNGSSKFGRSFGGNWNSNKDNKSGYYYYYGKQYDYNGGYSNYNNNVGSKIKFENPNKIDYNIGKAAMRKFTKLDYSDYYRESSHEKYEFNKDRTHITFDRNFNAGTMVCDFINFNKHTLILGELDFSFALSIINKFGNNHKVIVSSLHHNKNQTVFSSECQSAINANIKKIRNISTNYNNGGQSILLRNIDATDLRFSMIAGLGKNVAMTILFDRVIFALPFESHHNCFDIRNRHFIKNVIKNINDVVNRNNRDFEKPEIHLLMPVFMKRLNNNKEQFYRLDIEKLAYELGINWKLKTKLWFNSQKLKTAFPFYVPRHSNGHKVNSEQNIGYYILQAL